MEMGGAGKSMKKQIRRAGGVLLAGIMLFSTVSCGREFSNLQIIEELEPEPEYISFFLPLV